jgi:hypothetical protein
LVWCAFDQNLPSLYFACSYCCLKRAGGSEQQTPRVGFAAAEVSLALPAPPRGTFTKQNKRRPPVCRAACLDSYLIGSGIVCLLPASERRQSGFTTRARRRGGEENGIITLQGKRPPRSSYDLRARGGAAARRPAHTDETTTRGLSAARGGGRARVPASSVVVDLPPPDSDSPLPPLRARFSCAWLHAAITLTHTHKRQQQPTHRRKRRGDGFAGAPHP